jgi:hypothetical protein
MMEKFAGQVEDRLREKGIAASVEIHDVTDNIGNTVVHTYVTVPSADTKYGYSSTISPSAMADETVLKKELAIAADQIAKEITKEFSTYMQYNDRTVVMVEDLSSTVRTKCLCCNIEVELDEETIRQSMSIFSMEEAQLGEVSSFPSRSGYDSLTEEEKSVGKLYMLGKLDRECDCRLY